MKISLELDHNKSGSLISRSFKAAFQLSHDLHFKTILAPSAFDCVSEKERMV